MNLNKATILKRFVDYASHGTGSRENCNDVPTTAEQSIFLDRLYRELDHIVGDSGSVVRGKSGYVYARLNPTKGKKKIGFAAHVDTYPEISAKKINVQIHDYRGGNIVLNDKAYISEKDLKPYFGDTIITSDGTTLLGADDKAGVTAIVSAIEHMVVENTSHPEIFAMFTHDEEVGKGIDNFEIDKFPVDFAYTIDGEILGELEAESFNASKARVRVIGREHHPGYGYGKRRNAMYVGAKIVAGIPKEFLAESRKGREPYIEPDYSISNRVDMFDQEILIRSFEKSEQLALKEIIEQAVQHVRSEHPKYKITLSFEEQYGNMKDKIMEHPNVLDTAKRAFEMAGVPIIERPIRGGTDGCRLTLNYDIPTPNIFTGAHNIHSVVEFLPLKSLMKATEVITNISELSSEL